jgi:hypothetical protein
MRISFGILGVTDFKLIQVLIKTLSLILKIQAQANLKDQDQYLRADQLYRDIINSRTFPEIQTVIYYAALIDYDANLQLVRAQLRLLTQTEFELARFCTEEKLKKGASDHLICMIKGCAFIIEIQDGDLHADSIRGKLAEGSKSEESTP